MRGALATRAEAVSSAALGTEIRPTPLRVVLKMVKYSRRTIGDYGYDIARFLRHSSTFRYGSRQALAAKITATSHGIERGLSLPDPRRGFGERSIAYLLASIAEYVRRYGVDETLWPPADTLAAYLSFNEAQDEQVPNRPVIEALLARLGPGGAEPAGGTIDVRFADLRAATEGVSDAFFFSRHSIRQFTAEAVATADIDSAIAIAQRAPAVCNRQMCRVHVVRARPLMDRMLALQGSRGFNHQIDTLLLISNRLTSFGGTGERNQCWIDGGLFAMSLVLGLHAHGLGTCCLNWSKSAPEDRAMRQLLRLPPEEAIIMLVAVGHIPAELKVARSRRPPLAVARRFVDDVPVETAGRQRAPTGAAGVPTA